MMGKFTVALLTVWVLTLGVASQAAAFEGGGRKPSEAPLIAFGQHYTGQLNNHREDANYSNSFREVAIWRIPPVSTRDQVVVNWHELPYTSGSGFPICLILVQGIDDFSWGTVFGNRGSCSESGPAYTVAGSGTGQTAITVQNTDASSSYLEFYAHAEETNPTYFETYPYDFTVEPPRHFLGLAVKAKSKVHANGAIRGAVTLASGLPAPDGLPFTLTVTWGSDGVASYSTTTIGGQVVFPLALPEGAVNKDASFLVAHGADASYQEASAKIDAEVIPAVASAAEIACSRATQRAHSLARQVKRLKRNARFARGAGKRHLKHRARHLARKWSAARSQAQAACG